MVTYCTKNYNHIEVCVEGGVGGFIATALYFLNVHYTISSTNFDEK